MKYIIRLGKGLIAISLLLLLIINFVIKDTYHLSGFFFYAFPLPLIIFGFIGLGIIHIKNYRYAIILFFTTFILALCVYIHNYKTFEYTKEKEPAKTILYWNVAKQKDNNWSVLKKILKTQTIDIIILLEANKLSVEQSHDLEKTLPNYQTESLRGNMLIAVRGKLEHLEYIGTNTMNRENDFRINLVELTIENINYKIAAIDIYAKPSQKRKSAMNNILEYSTKNQVDIIIGDFNTPYESIYFSKYNRDYNSMRDYQNGFTYTWPRILPLLEIDQIWLKKKFRPIFMKKTFYKSSDHPVIIMHFSKN